MDECNKHGGVLHIYVDKASPQGNVYVKCPSVTVAVNAVNALHGRWFAGRIITAAYVPLINYHSLFPDSITATTPLRKWRASKASWLCRQSSPLSIISFCARVQTYSFPFWPNRHSHPTCVLEDIPIASTIFELNHRQGWGGKIYLLGFSYGCNQNWVCRWFVVH
jgi:hypothetical protein